MDADLFARVAAVVPDRYTLTVEQERDRWVFVAVPVDGGTTVVMDTRVDTPDDVLVRRVAAWIAEPFPAVWGERYGMR